MSKIKDVERSIEVIAGQVAAQQMLMETIIVRKSCETIVVSVFAHFAVLQLYFHSGVISIVSVHHFPH